MGACRNRNAACLLPALVLLGAAGCRFTSTIEGTPGEDAGFDAPLTTGSPFYPWDGSVPLFGSCGTDHECIYSAGAQCLTTFPGGLCTHRCDLHSQCGSGLCVMNVCLPPCGSDCTSAGGTCSGDPLSPYCVPSCGPGAPPCQAGTVCNPYSTACTTDPTTDAGANGAACKSDLDCNGFCIVNGTHIDGIVFVVDGFVDGMCASNGRAPANWIDGGALPASNCPDGSVVDPYFLFGFGQALCVPVCQQDSDCRPGYGCLTSDGKNTYSNGYCWPINCDDGVHTCPAPHVCNVSSADSGGGTCSP